MASADVEQVREGIEKAVAFYGEPSRESIARILVMAYRVGAVGAGRSNDEGMAIESALLAALNVPPWPWHFRLKLWFLRTRARVRRAVLPRHPR